MKYRLFSWLLLMGLLCGMMTGCGTQSGGDTSSVSASDMPSEPSAVPTEQTHSAVETVSVAEPQDDSIAGPGQNGLPLTDTPETLTIFSRAPSNSSVEGGITSNYDYAIYQELEPLTNVHIDWIEPSNDAADTQLSLILASGDFPDIINGFSYPTGMESAHDQEIILDLRELIEEYAPEYYKVTREDENVKRACLTDSGLELAFISLWTKVNINSSLFIRKDWLDGVNMDVPTTYSELTDVLTAFKTEYGAEHPLVMSEACVLGDASLGMLTSGFGSAGYNVVDPTGNGREMAAMYQVDGTVRCALAEDAFRDYLAQMNQWYETGILNRDFFSVSFDMFTGEYNAVITSGEGGLFISGPDSVPKIIDTAKEFDPAFEVMPIADISQNGNEKNHFMPERVDFIKTVVTTGCENPELAVKWLNYWFTDDGIRLFNYGVEGLTYEMEDNAPQWTDLIAKNKWGVSISTALRQYSPFGQFCGIYIQDSMTQYDTELQKQTRTLLAENTDNAYVLPMLTPTMEESARVGELAGDILTYASTEVVKFILGERDIETQWDNYVAELSAMGMEEILEIEQAAYQRYLER